ncbi:PhnD/SsuA/transferrin family substrate-binding protein [Shewanella sp. D64]|uniref:sensor histidine kinase n=1 Tax=unclassified Shewanella TaxID=196818 RepID=UPI0022BA3E9A|nr:MULTISPECIES: PhnD/SsuA/transferrin family substrate-binding protein [unclassified Shewanella]MEC4724076.1 PhnD/SsuA/transferrin family substrate-binding protein [Shewanella sp. D64]MEC4736096.1 PhnD/SsuA/transferrin family substrate-binding protein [Shewanella sp. E94]WBJ97960.1 PhnD/SsuA/transferrin family substrate-binding protein [Shewanella sp. MTB7]
MNRLLFVLISLFICTALQAKEPIRVGILSFATPEAVFERWQPTFDRVGSEIDQTFTLLPLTPVELQEHVAQQKLDFIISNALTSVTLKKDYGASSLLTLLPLHSVEPDDAVGSAIITRAGIDINQLNDLTKYTLISSDRKAFGGFQIIAGQLALVGINPFRDLKGLSFVGFPQNKLLNMVESGKADIAILPSCVFESALKNGSITEGKLKVVLQRNHPNYNCLTSSDLYPSYTFSKLGDTDHKLATNIVRALLSIDNYDQEALLGRYQYWSAPVNDSHVFELLKILNEWPFITNWEFLLKSALPWGIGSFIFLLLGYLHHLRVKRLVVLRTHALSAEMELHQQTQKSLYEQQKQFYKAQRVLLTGEMASGIAHELNQPLAGIRYLTQGCLYRLTPDQVELNTALNKAIQQVDRAQSTIKRFRQFCQQPSVYESCDLVMLIDETLNLMSPELKRMQLTPTLELTEVITVADISLLQQVLVNLIRNSLDAMENIHTAELTISLSEQHQQAVITICDNGIGLSELALSRLFFPFETSKQNGLGLGMVICKRIIEEHGGSIAAISLNNEHAQGLKVTLSLPIIKHCPQVETVRKQTHV